MNKVLLIAVLALSTLMPTPSRAHDEGKTRTVLIKRETLEEALGQKQLSGTVEKVGHEILYVDTEEGVLKVDVDDVNFPDRIKNIFYVGSQVVINGRFKGNRFIATRIVLIEDEIRKTYISRKPVDIMIRGEKENVRLRVIP